MVKVQIGKSCTVKGVAQRRRCSRSAVLAAIHAGELPGQPIISGRGRILCWLVDQAAADAWTPRPIGRPRKGAPC